MMVQEMKVSDLKIHPKNVRKTYSGIEELADSIKAKGILQNLTVVPDPEEEGKYLVVIGNRRLTAARLAGIETVPCKIAEMSEKDQVSTMLLENMQRNDLDIQEQAQGFQMVLDLGETVDGLSEKTGFSKTTIYHRVNIAKLDQSVLKEKNESFQLNLKNLYELEKIKDIEVRNKILEESNSSESISWKVQTALEKEKTEAWKKKNVEILKGIYPGIKKAPKNTEYELYGGRWKEIAKIGKEEYFKDDIEIPEGSAWVSTYSGMNVVLKNEKYEQNISEKKEKNKKKKEKLKS